jgi:hypothetical protein
MAEALPYATAGVRINVFFDHIMDHLRNHRVSAGSILGHVLAHEIGHVLLRVNAHGDTGLMKPGWTPIEYNSMAVTKLGFTTGESRMIRSNLRTPSQADRQPSFASDAAPESGQP